MSAALCAAGGGQIVWALPSGSVRAYTFQSGPSLRQAILLVLSNSGLAGLFISGPGTDELQEHPAVKFMAASPEGVLSRKKVSVVLIEIPDEEWGKLADWAPKAEG